MTYKIPSHEGAKYPRASVFYMSKCPHSHVLTSIASVANYILLLVLYTL